MNSKLLLLFLFLCISTQAQQLPKPYDWSTFAKIGQEKLESDFWLPGPPDNRNYYWTNDKHDDSTFYHYWVTAHAMETIMDAYERTGDLQYKARVRTMLDRIKLKEGGQYTTNFYDDMGWMGITCVRAYRLFNDEEYLVAAHQLLVDIKKGWVEPNGTEPGGMLWNKNLAEKDTRNACTHWTVACFAARLYLLEGGDANLSFAQKVYNWSLQYLYNTTQKASISKSHPEIQYTYVTYNQGVLIGASLALFDITKDQNYLTKAIDCADFCIDPSKTQMKENGIWRNEGKKDDLNDNNGIFKGILVHYFVDLIKSSDLPIEKRTAYILYLEKMGISMINNTRQYYLFPGVWDRSITKDEKIYLGCQLSGVILLESMDLFLRKYPALLKQTYCPSWITTGNYDTSWYDTLTDKTTPQTITITTAAQLAGLSKLSNSDATQDSNPNSPGINFDGWQFKLGASIDLSSNYWIGIGCRKVSPNLCSFKGNFNGMNYKISGLYIKNDPNVSNRPTGLFGYINGENSVFENLYIESGCISSNGGTNVGPLAGLIESTSGTMTFRKIGVGSVTVESTEGNVSGFVGKRQGAGETIFEDCFSIASASHINSLYGNNIAGFIATTPINAKVEMKNCYFAGTFKTVASNSYSGAFVGQAYVGNTSILLPTSKNLFYTQTYVYENILLKGLGTYTATGEDIEPIQVKSSDELKSELIISQLNDGRSGSIWSCYSNLNNGYPMPFSNKTTKVENYQYSNLKIISRHGEIIISGVKPGDIVSIFNLQGIKLFSTTGQTETSRFITKPGIYVIDNEGKKIKIFIN